MGAVLDIEVIKGAIRTVLNNNNEATSTVRDLSNGMENRVKIVTKMNPNLENMSSDKVPGVAIWLESKSISFEGIAKDQMTARREAEMSFKVAGFVYNSSVSKIENNESDTDIEKLMENIEYILRSDSNLSGNVMWTKATDVTYHNLSLAEQAHYKVGILNLQARKQY